MPFDAVNRLSRVAVRRGVLGGSNPWAVIALITGAIRLARRLNRPREAWVIKLEPGQTVIVASRQPSDRMGA